MNMLEVLADAPDGVVALDLNQRIVFWNRAAQRILGYSAEDALGTLCHEIFKGISPEGKGVCQLKCRAVMLARNDQLDSSYTMCITKKDKEPKWISMSHFLIPAEKSVPGTLVHIFHDLSTESQIKEESKQQSQSIPSKRSVSPLPIGIIESLTPRELEILSLLATGLGTRDVADNLVISETTVRNHTQHILAKLNVHSRLEAVLGAYRVGLI